MLLLKLEGLEKKVPLFIAQLCEAKYYLECD